MRVREETGSVDVIDGVEPRRFGAGVRGGSMVTVADDVVGVGGEEEMRLDLFLCEVFDGEFFVKFLRCCLK